MEDIRAKYIDKYIEYLAATDTSSQEEPATWGWARQMYQRGTWDKKEFIDQAWCLAMSNFDIIKTIKEKSK